MPFKKGQSGNPLGKPKGILNKVTILREERRAIFEAEMESLFISKIREARPEYLLDQYLGKAEDKLSLNANVNNSPMTAEVLAIAEEELKKRKLNDK